MEWNWPLQPAVRGDLVHDTPTSGRLAYDSDSIGITAKQMYVLLDPIESEALVMQTCIGSAPFRIESWTREETLKTRVNAVDAMEKRILAFRTKIPRR
jgi:hypothetical protein